MATNFLGLELPTVTQTIGPTWANEVNAAFEVIDAHDHTSNKGARIPSAGLNINESLDFNSNSIANLSQLKLISNNSTLTGATNANSTYVANGNLYFTNSSGTAVQLTDGGSVVTSAGALQTVETQAVSSDITISPSATFVFLSVDTTAARTITLPLANSVASGRIYIVKDVNGSSNTNNISLQTQGSDTIDNEASYTHNSDLGSFWVIGNGVSAWQIA
jgi:hypothetical protein